ncbi:MULTISPECIES: carboxylating nicotinate-nucleotide diphosphorylase [Sphingomonadaceae]|jgi:nicotinate-nucleotide pyrophosphorylase (carboxylating)|uniref:carboxylating nicotinate-nucleotide diphosphorylase n=1 Tax=Sphingomonadales TaxID=204457 RepID=UPI000CCBE86F|nr:MULTISPECIES: carboxylating nicotinate-nucleotide diphosphorylase [Sphingomonadaceae]
MYDTVTQPDVIRDELEYADLAEFAVNILREDLGSGGDVTSRVTIEETARLTAAVVSRDRLVLAGIHAAVAVFREMDPELKADLLCKDGDRLEPGDAIMRVHGNARALLGAERSALNVLQHLSGIATLTSQYVEKLEGTGCVLLDTRKTTPGLRALEKYAVRAGGGANHRMRLDDGILIKDNHVAQCGGVEMAVRAAKAAATGLEVQVEVDTLEQIGPALDAGADRLLCDNMSVAELVQAVRIVAGRVPIEASGGVTLETIRTIAETGVDFVSVGRITQSAPAADIGLDYVFC